jgi:hypothetical protein
MHMLNGIDGLRSRMKEYCSSRRIPIAMKTLAPATPLPGAFSPCLSVQADKSETNWEEFAFLADPGSDRGPERRGDRAGHDNGRGSISDVASIFIMMKRWGRACYNGRKCNGRRRTSLSGFVLGDKAVRGHASVIEGKRLLRRILTPSPTRFGSAVLMYTVLPAAGRTAGFVYPQ